jgi:hypothetical protein
MVPAMALITASAAPRVRGGFMSLNTAVQHMAAGAATMAAGRVITTGEGDALVGYSTIGALAAVATAVSIVLAGRLRRAPGGDAAPDAAEFAHAGRRAAVK